jgi:Rieske Fe-S protein
MERREFLGSLTGPVVAVCAVCMGACSKSSSSPSNGTTTPPPAGVNFIIDLNTTLVAVGSSMVQSGVIIVRLATGNVPASFTAVQVACTHQGTSINYEASGNKFVCPNHGSNFSTSGAVTLGPAASALKQYNVSISGNMMTITG